MQFYIWHFLSSEKTSTNSLTMKEVVVECNQEFANKLQAIQDSNPHDDYVLDGSMASWKDILLVYTIIIYTSANT